MGVYTPQQLGIKTPKGGFSTGGWFNSRQYWNGTLSEPGQIHPESNQQGAGQEVSKEVVAQSNPAQGQAPGTNEAYIAAEKAKAVAQPVAPATPAPVQPAPTTQPANNTATTTPGGVLSPGQPTIDVQSIYNQAFKTPEIDTANKSVSDVQAEIDTTTNAYNEAKAIINDNPLYGYASMRGKEDKLSKKFNDDLNRLQNKKAIEQDNLAKLKADAEIKVNLAMKQYDINNQAYKDQLSLFNTLLDAGALNNASGTDIASYAAATGIPTSMIQSIIDKQKKDEIKPQVITSTDDAGNMTVAVIDSYTGTVISKSSLGKIGKADQPTKPTTQETSTAIKTQAMQDARSGLTLEDMFKIYTGFLTGNEIYSIYNSNSSYGPAESSKWTPDTLAKYGVNVKTGNSLLEMLNQ